MLVFAIFVVFDGDVVVIATLKVDLRLLVMEVEFGWVVVWLGGGGEVVVCKNCVGLLLVLLGEVAYKISDHYELYF